MVIHSYNVCHNLLLCTFWDAVALMSPAHCLDPQDFCFRCSRCHHFPVINYSSSTSASFFFLLSLSWSVCHLVAPCHFSFYQHKHLHPSICNLIKKWQQSVCSFRGTGWLWAPDADVPPESLPRWSRSLTVSNKDTHTHIQTHSHTLPPVTHSAWRQD